MFKRKKNKPAIKMHRGATGHRRGDKYLFANKKTFKGISYKKIWEKSGTSLSFENWFEENVGSLQQYRPMPPD